MKSEQAVLPNPCLEEEDEEEEVRDLCIEKRLQNKTITEHKINGVRLYVLLTK
jgi:hypothetical protein